MFKFHSDKKFKAKRKVKKNKKGRRYVITDIHGYYDTFCKLLEKIKLKKHDQLFLLGDFIDRGRKGKEVLDKVISLIDEGYLIYPLRGNHEQAVLDSHRNIKKNGPARRVPTLGGTKGIRDEKRLLLPKYFKLIKKLPYFYQLDDFLLVHAGFDFSKVKPFKDYHSMIWIRNYQTDLKATKGRTIIHGHTRRGLSLIKKNIKSKANIIGIDNMIHKKIRAKQDPEYGNMLCLDLDSYELIIQKRIN